MTPVALALPVVGRPLASPKPVPPTVSEHVLAGVDARTAQAIPGWGTVAGPAPARPLLLSPIVRARTFSAFGVTWDGGDEVEVVARVRQGGRWGGWHVLDADPDHEPDATSPDARTGRLRNGTSPWFHGPADAYQVRVGVVEGAAPRNVRVSLVDPGTSAADGVIGARPTFGNSTAEASIGRPSYITRAQWGADESLRDGSPDYGSTVKVGFVHHTDTSNSYSTSGAAAMVRSVYAFHTRSRGWSDIGYNFLVDKYGRIFEGRYGGVDRPVIGAHTGGFNTDTFGTALLGDYTSYAPSSAQLRSLQRLFAWKLGLHYVNPVGRTTLTSRGGTKYAAGTRVTFNNVSGHRDAGLTSCPGNYVYNRLPTIRSGIKSAMGASLYYPSVSTTRPFYLTTPSVAVRATAPVTQAWRLDVRRARTGSLARSITGAATTRISAVWNLRDSNGNLVPPDTYTLTLSSWTSRTKARPYVVKVSLLSPLPSGVATTYGPYQMVENGALADVPAALAKAVRPMPALPSFYGQRSSMAYATAAPRDGLFVKSADSGALYLMVDGYRWRISSTTASALALSAPLSLPTSVLGNAPLGPTWTRTDRHPDGFVVQGSNGTRWRIESGVRRPFTSSTSAARWARGLVVPAALAGDLALPLGAPLAPPEGTLLRTATGAGVVSGGTFRPLTDPGALGYSLGDAPLATAGDIDALPAGEPVGTDRHPTGALLRDGTRYYEVMGTAKRAVARELLAGESRLAVAAKAGEVAALSGARWLPPDGLAGRDATGVVRVVAHGRLVTLTPSLATALGYTNAPLPALAAADFGPVPVARALANAAVHPAGTLVTDGTTTWWLDGGYRRPVPASIVPTWLGRPPLPATSADLALPLGPVAPTASGAWVITPDGTRWLVDRSVRRAVPGLVSRRLGLDAVTPIPVVAAELNRTTIAGSLLP